MNIEDDITVTRTLCAYFNETDELAWEQEIEAFALPAFQKEFGVTNPANPMYDCWPVLEHNIPFMEQYFHNVHGWDFSRFTYFVETSAA
ncbi:MAG TPA: hypothetical protein VF269_04135 [Rhodanobacteraceae bacterium]